MRRTLRDDRTVVVGPGHVAHIAQCADAAAGAMKILYVEDYVPSAALLRASLARSAPEIRVDIVPTVAQALERLRRIEVDPDMSAGPGARVSARYDVILTDLNLGDGSGLE